MSKVQQWISEWLRFSGRSNAFVLLGNWVFLSERKWMHHISCLWTRISKCLPYLEAPHGSWDREIVSFSSFPQPEWIDLEQYQISSFPETFWTPKYLVAEKCKSYFFFSPLLIFYVKELSQIFRSIQ